MKMQYRLIISILFILILAVHSGKGEASLVQRIKNDDPLVRNTASFDLLIFRQNMIKELISYVKQDEYDPYYRGTMHHSIELLGVYRASEAIVVLADRIAFLPIGMPTDEMMPTQAYYVAAAALRKIGMPSLNQMTGIIAKTKVPKKAELATWVIMEVLGKEEAIWYINNKKIQRPLYEEGFLKSIEYIENYKVTFTRPDEYK